MGVWSIVSDGFRVDDAGPNGGQWEEDADDGRCDDAEFDHVVPELEAGDNG